MNRRRLLFSLWLLPCSKDHEILSENIISISDSIQGPVFDPHVTLFSGHAETKGDFDEILNRIPKLSSPLKLKSLGISVSRDYFKSIFIKFELGRTLKLLQALFLKELIDPEHYDFVPHLSLAYSHSPIGQKLRVANSLILPKRAYSFDSIRIITPGDASEEWQNVALWEMRPKVRLVI